MINIIDTRKNKDINLFNKLISRSQLGNEDVSKTVEEIINDIKINGDSSVLKYTKRFDNVELTTKTQRVSQKEIDEAYNKVDKKFIEGVNIGSGSFSPCLKPAGSFIPHMLPLFWYSFSPEPSR